MGYTVGIVGASGAVGKELKQLCEATTVLPIDKLRLFGSSRSAGTKFESIEKFGTTIEVELFDVSKARECQIVFLAVSGSFALEHAEAISAGEDGAVVIDNSVSTCT
jgi:aspartate-semialdehyde dehydrogenase